MNVQAGKLNIRRAAQKNVSRRGGTAGAPRGHSAPLPPTQDTLPEEPGWTRGKRGGGTASKERRGGVHISREGLGVPPKTPEKGGTCRLPSMRRSKFPARKKRCELGKRSIFVFEEKKKKKERVQ